jgi:uncharacterized repeat protein (TIGR03843 family)
VSRSIRLATSARGETATPTDRGVLEGLRDGRLEVVGRLTDASNATFLVSIDDVGQAVYKPIRGERPLDDFPPRSLANREVAAFLLSEATGWGVVPPSVMRDGPFGRGMVQQWIELDDDEDVLQMVVAVDNRLRQMCVFDVLANNADRKGGHILPTLDGHVYGCDHGICFASEPKLRTILWGWRGQELTDDELSVVKQVCDGLDGELGAALGELLSAAEVRATSRRAESLLRTGRFPQPDPSRPALPWPPF